MLHVLSCNQVQEKILSGPVRDKTEAVQCNQRSSLLYITDGYFFKWRKNRKTIHHFDRLEQWGQQPQAVWPLWVTERSRRSTGEKWVCMVLTWIVTALSVSLFIVYFKPIKKCLNKLAWRCHTHNSSQNVSLRPLHWAVIMGRVSTEPGNKMPLRLIG